MYDNIFHKLSHKFKILSLCYLNNSTQLAVDECHVNGKLFTWENNAADLNLESFYFVFSKAHASFNN